MKTELPMGAGVDRFNATMDKILSVSHEELERCLESGLQPTVCEESPQA